jgi:hypothetical protein
MPSPLNSNVLEAPARGQRLWTIWWLCGIPVAWATSGMIILAELIRNAGYWGWGDLIDVTRLLVYFSWARLAWRCSHNADDRRWMPVSRFALGVGLVSMAMF